MSQYSLGEFNSENLPGHPDQPTGNDGSGPLFSMYMQIAGGKDRKMTDNWKADADGILIFTGLFSAAVATLVALSVQDLKPSSQDTSAFYLANIYQHLADANGSHVFIPPTLIDPSRPFTPPKHAVWVNSLWFLSLVIDLTCALLATFLQQWARRFVHVTQLRHSPHKRARIRAFYSRGVDKLRLPWVVTALPALLHLSLFLFFVGLVIFLFNINQMVFKVAMSWIGVCAGLYVCITFMPIFRRDSPYYSPLSSSTWFLYSVTLFVVLQTYKWILSVPCVYGYFHHSTMRHVESLSTTYRQWISKGMTRVAEETAYRMSSQIDEEIFAWTFNFLDDDHERERFWAVIPDFCNSTDVVNPHSCIAKLDSKMRHAFKAFLDSTFSSGLVPETTKERRFIICMRTIEAAHLSNVAWDFLQTASSTFQHLLLRSMEIRDSLRTWRYYHERETALCTQSIITYIIANAPKRDQSWFALARDHLCVSDAVLQDYIVHGHSVQLANLIHFARQLLPRFQDSKLEIGAILKHILPSVSRLEVRGTLLGLQHDFCDLWNEIVRAAYYSEYNDLVPILQCTRHIYVALHPGSDSSPIDSTPDVDITLSRSSSYPLCIIPGHRSSSMSLTNVEVSDQKRAEATHPLPATSSSQSHDPGCVLDNILVGTAQDTTNTPVIPSNVTPIHPTSSSSGLSSPSIEKISATIALSTDPGTVPTPRPKLAVGGASPTAPHA